MRALFDQFGWFVQFAIGVAVFVGLYNWSTLPGWAAGVAAIGASFVGTWLLAVFVGFVVDAAE